MITQIDHIEIIVKDVKEYVDFYQKLGFKLLQWTDHHGRLGGASASGPNQPIFEIHTVIDEENIGVNPIAFKTDDLITTYEELKAAGIEFSNEPYRNRHTGGAMSASATPDGWRLQMCDGERKEPDKGVPESEVKDEFKR